MAKSTADSPPRMLPAGRTFGLARVCNGVRFGGSHWLYPMEYGLLLVEYVGAGTPEYTIMGHHEMEVVDVTEGKREVRVRRRG